jgi:hypothetical protein
LVHSQRNCQQNKFWDWQLICTSSECSCLPA